MKKMTLAFTMIAGLTACIGGEELPNNYTGTTEPAEITTDNTTDIIEIVSDSNMSKEFTSVFSGASYKAMRKGVRSALSLSDASTLAEGGTVEGDCGGTLKMDVSQTNGSIKYSDFCEIDSDGSTETTTNGSLTMSGSATSTGGGTFKYTMDITSTDGTYVSKTAGTLNQTTMVIDNEFKTTLVMSLTSTDSESEDSIMLDNYTLKTGGFAMISMSGKICTTDIAGCITVSTPVDFTIAENTFNQYTAGTLQIDSGSSEVTISVNSDGDCDLSVDIDGDGTADSSDTQNCSNYL